MVNMVGFHHKEPVFNTAKFGEEGWFISCRVMPTEEYPNRVLLNTPCGWNLFYNQYHAHLFVYHPGDVAYRARHYLDLPYEGVIDFSHLQVWPGDKWKIPLRDHR